MKFISDTLVGLWQTWAGGVAEEVSDGLEAAKACHIRVLLSGHCQVCLLELLTVNSILEQRQVVEGLLFVQVATTLGEFSGKSAEHIVNSS